MLVFIVARSVGNRINEGLYDTQISIKKMPFLQQVSKMQLSFARLIEHARLHIYLRLARRVEYFTTPWLALRLSDSLFHVGEGRGGLGFACSRKRPYKAFPIPPNVARQRYVCTHVDCDPILIFGKFMATPHHDNTLQHHLLQSLPKHSVLSTNDAIPPYRNAKLFFRYAGTPGRDPDPKYARKPAHVEGSRVPATDRDSGGYHDHPSRLRPQLFPGSGRPGTARSSRCGAQVKTR